MGLRLSFGFGPLRASVPLTGRRRRRHRRRRPAARQAQPGFHAEVRLPGGSVYTCHHAHRTQQAAAECAAKYSRSVSARPTGAHAAPQRIASPPEPAPAAPRVGKPPQWWPRSGWGTVRNYREDDIGYGRANVSFLFVPDDGERPRPFDLPGVTSVGEMGEFARGYLRGDNLTIKVSARTMAEAERTFQRVNRMPLPERQRMFAERTDLEGDAGWTWAADYTLVEAAPGLAR